VISFIIPAHNEEDLLPSTLQTMRSAADAFDQPYEIIVVNDASTDATCEIAEQAGARVISIDRRHIAAARNAGAAAARGDAFIFVDVDTTITAEVYRATLKALADGAQGGGCMVRFDPPVPQYARLMLPLALWVNRTFRMAAGCYVYATRGAFAAAGGFDESLLAGEETIFSRAMHKVGRFEVLDAAVTTSGRKLRAYSATTIFGTMFKLAAIALINRKAFSSRKHFDLWYAPRREDPKESRKPETANGKSSPA
jgi:glycosyltransferase involved in cell wall biosynthesis